MNQLDKLRVDINVLDTELLRVLGERFSATRKIGHIKRANKLMATDESRFNDLLDLWRECATGNKVNPDVAESILTLIHHAVVNEHIELSAESNCIS